MGLAVLEGLAVIVAAMMTGNELCLSLVNARLRRTEERTQFEATRALAGSFGAFMPFWYAATFLLSGAVAYALRGSGPAAFLADTAAALWLVSIVYSVTVLVPINSRIATPVWETRPADWAQEWRTWDTRHTARVALLVLALGCLVAACLSARL